MLQKFKQYILQHHLFQAKDKLLIAVSGGVDSVLLCELCHQAGYDFAIAHCNFKLRAEESDNDETFVKLLAQKYGTPFFVTHFETQEFATQQKMGIQEAARNLRYNWFKQIATQHHFNCILTAHHADDSIETLLMNFFKGTGIKGLHGILPKENSFFNIVRPLLFAKKLDILNVAATLHLSFVQDSSNASNKYTRNYFRNELIPALQLVYPSVQQNLLSNIDRFAAAEILYQQAIDAHKKKLIEIKGVEIHIPILKLQKVNPMPTILFEIIKEYGFNFQQTNEAIGILNSESGRYIQSSTHTIIKNRKWLIIAPIDTEVASNILIENGINKIEFAGGILHIKNMDALNELQPSKLVAQLEAKDIQFPLLLRKWKQGDYFYPLGMKHKKKLSRFFIDQKLSITDKEKVWVIESNKKIIWVLGMRIDDRFKVTLNTKAVINFIYEPKLK
jgi:tRNA(Ile)-lysidine synthase